MKTIARKTGLRGAALLCAALSVAATAAYATPITYQFTLTPKTGTIGGSVLVTFDEAIPASGSFDANNNDSDTATTTKITSLVATLSNGDKFTLANAPGGVDIGFFNGVANNFSYYANSTTPILQLQGVGSSNNQGYQFSGDGNFSSSDPAFSAGTLVFAGTAATATPEPSSLILLGTGLVGLAAAARRKLAS